MKHVLNVFRGGLNKKQNDLIICDDLALSMSYRSLGDLFLLLQYELSHDSRDDTVLPSRGQYMKLTQELAGLGGNAHFYSKLLSVQTNHELIDRVVSQAGATTSGLFFYVPSNYFLVRPQLLNEDV